MDGLCTLIVAVIVGVVSFAIGLRSGKASDAGETCEFDIDGYGDGNFWYACSKCGGYVSANYDTPAYCPHCGAKVRGDR